MTEAEAIEVIKYRCEQRLGHLGRCHVSIRDCGTVVGVGLELSEKQGIYRHMVSGAIWSADPYGNPILFADACCDRLIEFFQRHAAADSAAGGQAPKAASIDTSLPS